MNTPKNKQNRMAYLENIGTPMLIPPSPQLQKLGYGTGVQVYRIERSPSAGTTNSPWAVKRTRRNDDNALYSERLVEEAALLRTLIHPNIVGFRGWKQLSDGRNALIMEDCHISLGDILEDRNDEKLDALPVKQIKTMCSNVTNALEYLHNVAHILHGDIKSFNVLVKGDFEICKLCDFGVSQPLNADGYIDVDKKPNAKYIGTDLWSSPEVFVSDNTANISAKADIFSFGLVIYECVALIPPHRWIFSGNDKSDDEFDTTNESTEMSKTNHVDDDDDEDNSTNSGIDIDAIVGTRPPFPEASFLSNDYNQIIEVFYLCTNENPEDRPTALFLSELFK